MSHFVLHVLVPSLKTPSAGDLRPLLVRAKAQIDPLLAPFSEALEAEPYFEPCYCVGRAAQISAKAEAERQVGTLDSLRATFALRYPGLTKVDRWSENADRDLIEKSDEIWMSEFVEPLNTAEKKAFAAHPLKDAVNPDCNECNGSGKVETTYNKKSQWDWYTIGGRWNGCLHGVDPADDKDNWQQCWLCHGTGKRADMEVRNGCNGCSGKGISLKYPSDQKDAGNVMPVSEFAPRLDKRNAPFAILTPEGEWLERGEMGWFGAVGEEKKKGDWVVELAAVYRRFPDADIVLVDCHI